MSTASQAHQWDADVADLRRAILAMTAQVRAAAAIRRAQQTTSSSAAPLMPDPDATATEHALHRAMRDDDDPDAPVTTTPATTHQGPTHA